MGKISAADKMRLQTLHEQGLEAKATVKAYPEKQWKLSSVRTICRRIDNAGQWRIGELVVDDRAETVNDVSELICSYGQSGTQLSTRQTASHP